MLSTLRATVQGDKIHWEEAVGDLLPPGCSVEVLVTILGDEARALSPEERGRRRVAALQKMAETSALQTIEDPVQWQRAARGERPLPGRES